MIYMYFKKHELCRDQFSCNFLRKFSLIIALDGGLSMEWFWKRMRGVYGEVVGEGEGKCQGKVVSVRVMARVKAKVRGRLSVRCW